MTGQVVSSQAYMDNQGDNAIEDPPATVDESTPVSNASEDDGEAEWKACNVTRQALTRTNKATQKWSELIKFQFSELPETT